ncbi:MAG: hypothetical protein HC893_03860 [Chloroflexaceae bacterium]|nr:hypothetical protein [Chloroflexaceae bacterium]
MGVAARNPLFLAVLVVALITGLTAEIWLLPAGIVVYVLAVVLASRDTRLQARQQSQQRRQGLSSRTFLDKINQIEYAQREVEQAIDGATGVLKRTLQQSLGPQTRELTDQAHNLARKGQTIEAYLMQINPMQVQSQIDEITARIQRTTDQYTREQLEGTHQALVAQRESADVLRTYIGRITSQLDNILANLRAMPAQILRMRASDVDAQMVSEQVAAQLSDLNSDMQSFVSVLDTAIGQTTAAGPY